jgi:hypothetical protein
MNNNIPKGTNVPQAIVEEFLRELETKVDEGTASRLRELFETQTPLADVALRNALFGLGKEHD